MDLKKFDTFLFDLDDTIWRISKLLPGAKEIVSRLKQEGKKVYFITNNNLMTREELAKRLARLGIPTKKEEVINTVYIASLYFKKRKGTVMVFGKALKKELKKNKIRIKKYPPVDYVLIGDDLSFNFDKIALAIQAIQDGARFVACNVGKRWYIGNRLVPGVGSLAASIEYATDVHPTVLGKPHTPMLQVVRKYIKNPAKTVMVGDDAVDVMFAKRLKCKSIFLSSKKIKGVNPDLRVESIMGLISYLRH